jgi:hypothetical protein
MEMVEVELVEVEGVVVELVEGVEVGRVGVSGAAHLG